MKTELLPRFQPQAKPAAHAVQINAHGRGVWDCRSMPRSCKPTSAVNSLYEAATDNSPLPTAPAHSQSRCA